MVDPIQVNFFFNYTLLID